MNPILKRIPKDIAAIIFDLDGTLANTLPFHYKAWEMAGEKFKVPITAADIDRLTGMPSAKVAEELKKENGYSYNSNVIAAAKQKFYLEVKSQHGSIKAFPRTLEVVKLYHGSVPMSVGTGSKRSSALMALEDMKLLDYFKVVVTASDVVNPKPHPETFLKCAELMDVAPEQCLVLEDGDMGIQAAISANMKVLDVRGLL